MACVEFEPVSGTFVGYAPLPDATAWKFSVPGGITIEPDGKVGLLRVTVCPKDNRLSATLRAFPGDPNETLLAYRQGYMASHSDANQDDFVIYAKGAPLTVMSLPGHAVHSGECKKLFDEFGWHSRVHFGKQSDSGVSKLF